jgi:zinc/manganese transport system substrate-binding protein
MRGRRGVLGVVASGARVLLLCVFAFAAVIAGGGSGRGPSASGASAPIRVVAAENFWGSVAAQLTGDRAQTRSIITNPATDPHDYEPTPADGKTLARAQYVIVNGAGYDPWAPKLLNANPVAGRRVLDMGKLVGVKEGGNPHLWYSPVFVRRGIDQITSDLKQLDPADAAYFDRQRSAYLTQGLRQYDMLRAHIRQKYAGVPVGSTESIFVYLGQDLNLKILTPPGFMNAISEGTDPTAADKAAFDRQIETKQIKVLVFNTQNATPDVQALVKKAKARGIPVTTITETLDPANLSYQAWQSQQLQRLADALAAARR